MSMAGRITLLSSNTGRMAFFSSWTKKLLESIFRYIQPDAIQTSGAEAIFLRQIDIPKVHNPSKALDQVVVCQEDVGLLSCEMEFGYSYTRSISGILTDHHQTNATFPIQTCVLLWEFHRRVQDSHRNHILEEVDLVSPKIQRIRSSLQDSSVPF